MSYELRWGKNTWIAALMMGGTAGIMILLLSWHMMGEYWHVKYFVPMLGYYVMISICQSHYFKSDLKPHIRGMIRQAMSIFGAVLIFYLHGWIMGDLIGIPEKLIMPSHFIFIILGFFFFGWDDFMFKGVLSRWLKVDAVKALFWYMFIWMLWFPLFAMDGGLSSALGNFNPTRFFWFLGSFQWVIMMELMIAITWREYLGTIKFKNDLMMGAALVSFALTAGFLAACVCYSIIDIGDTIPTEAAKSHHVLHMGTYPLIPIVMFGIYSHHFNHIEDQKKKAFARTGLIASMAILGYFIFGFATAPSGIFGEHPWYHHFDLAFNFTIAIIPLSHHWFTGRWGFVRVVKE